LATLKWKAANLYSTTNSTETNSTSILPTSAVTYALAQSINEMGDDAMLALVHVTLTLNYDTGAGSTIVTYSNCSSKDGVVVESTTTSGSYANSVIRFQLKQAFASPIDGYDKIVHIFNDCSVYCVYKYPAATTTSSQQTAYSTTTDNDATVYLDEDNNINVLTGTYLLYKSGESNNKSYPLGYVSVSVTVSLLVQK
jgi:hypothetical protein